MTHTKHRKRRERAEREEAERRLENQHPIFTELQRKLQSHFDTGRTGRAG